MGSESLEKDKTNFTKYDLKDGDIVTLRNGAKLVYCDDCFYDIGNVINNGLYDLDDLTDDLRLNANSATWTNEIKDNDIMIVERPDSYTTIWHREEVKEMTLAQVCEELGYNVKIIKEE